MTPQIGQHVKCFLRNTMVVEGIVELWSADGVVLKSLDGESQMFIHQPVQDIVITKALQAMPEISQHSEKPEITDPALQQEWQCALEDDDGETDPLAMAAKTTAELKVELSKQERRVMAGKLKEHHLGQTRKVTYGQPGFYKKPSTQHHSK